MKMCVLSTFRKIPEMINPTLYMWKHYIYKAKMKNETPYFLTLSVLHCYFSYVSINKQYLPLAVQSALLWVLLRGEMIPVLKTFIL